MKCIVWIVSNYAHHSLEGCSYNEKVPTMAMVVRKDTGEYDGSLGASVISCHS